MRSSRASRVLFLSSLLKIAGYVIVLLIVIPAIVRVVLDLFRLTRGSVWPFISLPFHQLLLIVVYVLICLALSEGLALLVEIGENSWRTADKLEGNPTVPTPRIDE